MNVGVGSTGIEYTILSTSSSGLTRGSNHANQISDD